MNVVNARVYTFFKNKLLNVNVFVEKIKIVFAEEKKFLLLVVR